MRSFLSFVVLSILATSFATSICLAEGPRVWVQPFTEANDHQSADWITKTLQQSLVDELASAKGIQLLQASAKPADVHFVVTGQIQRLDGELRVSGQVIDAATNKPVGGYKATGSDRELFGIEDSIAEQVKPIVTPADQKSGVAVAGATTQPSNIQMPFAPNRFGIFQGSDLEQSLHTNAPLQPADNTVYVPTPVYTQTPTYPTNYGLNGSPYGYGYPYNYGWGGGGVVIIGGGGGGDGHHHHVDNGLPRGNGQAIRAASSFSGNPPAGIVNTTTPNAPGSINTIGPAPSMGHGR